MANTKMKSSQIKLTIADLLELDRQYLGGYFREILANPLEGIKIGVVNSGILEINPGGVFHFFFNGLVKFTRWGYWLSELSINYNPSTNEFLLSNFNGGIRLYASSIVLEQDPDGEALRVTSDGTPKVWIGNLEVGNLTLNDLSVDNLNAGTIQCNGLSSPLGEVFGYFVTAYKVTAMGYDPIYEINGKKYATFLSGINGIREELTGIVYLQNVEGKYVGEIDFENAIEGSDIWVFKQITDFGENWENLVVLLTAGFDGKVWYEKKINEGKIIVYGDREGEVSYRLCSLRFDHQNWDKEVSDEKVKAIKVISKNA